MLLAARPTCRIQTRISRLEIRWCTGVGELSCWMKVVVNVTRMVGVVVVVVIYSEGLDIEFLMLVVQDIILGLGKRRCLVIMRRVGCSLGIQGGL
jgi:hypothetical protein